MMIWLVYLLVLFHGLIVLPSIIIGPIVLSFSKKNLRWLENIFIIIGGTTALSYLITGSCFLTVWEQNLRTKINPELSYSSGFVSFYLSKIGINFPDLATTFAITFFIVLGMMAILNRRIKGYPIINFKSSKPLSLKTLEKPIRLAQKQK